MNVRIGVIACGGKGLRLGMRNTQKCLFEIEGRPMLEYIIEAFVSSGIKVIFFLTGYHRERVDNYLARSRGKFRDCELVSAYGGVEGEVAALSKLRHFLFHQELIYSGGEVIFPHEIVASLLKIAKKSQDSLAIMSVSSRTDITSPHPRVVVVRGTNYVSGVVVTKSGLRTSSAKLVSTGPYYFRPGVFHFLEEMRPDQPLADFVNKAIGIGCKISASVTDYPWFCLHTKNDLKSWHKSAMKKYSTGRI